MAGLLATAVASHGALIAYWNMDEASGNITDQVAGIVGTASAAGLTYGQPSVPAGVYGSITIPLNVATSFGQAIAFERANTGHFSVGSPASIAGLAPGGSNGSFTVMAWVNASIGGNSNGSDSFNGLIDELKIFDTALSRKNIIVQASIPEPSATLLVPPALALLIRRQRAGVAGSRMAPPPPLAS